MAEELRDTSMMSKLVGGNLVAIDAKYHNSSLSAYKNRYRSLIIISKVSLHGSKVEKPLWQEHLLSLLAILKVM